MTALLLIFSAVKVLRGVSIVRCQHQVACACVRAGVCACTHMCACTWVCTCACVFYSQRLEGTNSDPMLRSLETHSETLCRKSEDNIFIFD